MRRRLEDEISPFNATARRGPNGFWSEHLLPITEWEDPDQRVVVPAMLVASLTLPVAPVLRWDAAKYREVVAKHPRDRRVIANLTMYLATWQYHGEETGAHVGNQRILFQDESGRWHAVSIGPLQGSDNVITVFGSSKPNFVDNRLQGMRHVVGCEK